MTKLQDRALLAYRDKLLFTLNHYPQDLDFDDTYMIEDIKSIKQEIMHVEVILNGELPKSLELVSPQMREIFQPVDLSTPHPYEGSKYKQRFEII
jgi:hypothetical protein